MKPPWSLRSFFGCACVRFLHLISASSFPAGATNLALAVPANASDPFHTNWTKDGKLGSLTGYVNPIANNTGRDPSTAWRTPSGGAYILFNYT